jgi:hypothetical protein
LARKQVANKVKRTALTRKTTLGLLDRLEASCQDYLTIYVKPSSLSTCAARETSVPDLCPEVMKQVFGTEAVLREAQRYETGAVIFWSEDEYKNAVLPPFPIARDESFQGKVNISSLRELLEEQRSFALVLVTWGSYALGVVEGDELVKSKTGTGYIQKAHRKGGWSQKRFARRTEEQKRDFLRRVANRVEGEFSKVSPEQFFFGGNRLILNPLLEECPYLRAVARRISKRSLNVRYARRQDLLRCIDDVYKSVVFTF